MMALHYLRTDLNGGAILQTTRPHAGKHAGKHAFVIALGSVSALLAAWHRATETRRARHRLLQLDDHLLADVGLSRADVRFGQLIPPRWGC